MPDATHLLAFVLVAAASQDRAYGGLANRLAVTIGFGWVAALAYRLFARAPAARGSG